MNFDRADSRCRTCQHQKVFGIGNEAMGTCASEQHALFKCFARALTKSGVIHLLIHLMHIFRETACEPLQTSRLPAARDQPRESSAVLFCWPGYSREAD